MVITVIGMGFVGLTAAVGFAAKGHQVYGIEKNDARRHCIENGELPFFEPEMQEYLAQTLNRNFYILCRREFYIVRFSFTKMEVHVWCMMKQGSSRQNNYFSS